MGRYVAYIRVSTKDQNLDRQLEDINYELARDHHTVDKLFQEKVSGKSRDKRPELEAMLEYVQKGDVLIVESYSRLARSLRDLLNIVDELKNKGVNFISVKENIDTSTAQGELMFHLFASLAEFERKNMLQRVDEGIKVKKSKGDWVLRGDLFGYCLSYDKGNPVVTINEKEAKYVRTLFQEYADGDSSVSLVRKYKDAVFAETGFRLGSDSINRLLFKPIYMGYYTVQSLSNFDKTEKKTRDYTRIARLGEEQLRKELVKSNLYEPIVSEELWFKCYNSYRTVTRKNAQQYAYRDSPYELTSVIHTSCNCHSAFIHANFKRGNYEIYKPTKHNNGCNDPMYPTLREDVIIPIMRMTYFLTFNMGGHLKSYITEKQNKIDESQEELKKQEEDIKTKIAQLDKEKKNLVDFIRKNGFDVDIEEDIQKINEDKESLKRQLDKVTESMSLSSNSWLKELGNFCINALDGFKNAETAEKRRDLYLKYCTAEMSRDTLTVEYFNTEKFVVHWEFTRKGQKKPFKFENYWRGELERTGTIEPCSKTVTLNLNEWEYSYESFIAHFPEGYFDGGAEVWNNLYKKHPDKQINDFGKFIFDRMPSQCLSTGQKATEYLRSIEDRSPRELITE